MQEDEPRSTGEWIAFRSAPGPAAAASPSEKPLEVAEIIAPGLAELPDAIRTEVARERLVLYVERLLDTNTRINLVSRRGTTHHVSRFVRESLFLAGILHRDRSRFPDRVPRLLDLGSGGGFPGVVLKIALPDVEVQLVEGTRKKATFLAEVAAALDLPGMSVLWGRSEQIARLEGAATAQRFDWVTGKALGTLVESCRLAAPFLVPGGVHWTFKGAACEAELAQAGGYFRQAGLAPFALEVIPGQVESYVVGVRKHRRGR